MVRRLLFINGLAILAVILFHSVGMGFVAMFAWAGRYLPAGVTPAQQIGGISYYVLRFLEQLPVFSIPAFLFVSGYFVAIATSRDNNSISWKIVISRIKYLLIPYLIWSGVALLLNIATGISYSFRELVEILITGGASEVLYYVPLLIQFYLLSPLLVRIARKNWIALLLFVGVLQILVQLLTYQVILDGQSPVISIANSLLPKWIFLSRILWFPLGIVVGLQSSRVKAWLEKYRAWLVPVALVSFVLALVEWEWLYRSFGELWLPHRETLFDNIYSLVVISTLLTVKRFPVSLDERISTLGSKSYGIFLTHGIFIVYFAKVIYNVAPAILGYQFILLPLLFISGLVGPLLIMTMVDRSFLRREYTYIYG